MERRTKSKGRSLKSRSLGLKENQSQLSSMPSQTALPSCQQDRPKLKNGSAKNKPLGSGKAKKEGILKKLQEEIKQIKGQISQLKAQCPTCTLTPFSTQENTSSESSESLIEHGRRKMSQLRNHNQSKIHSGQSSEMNKQNKNGSNLSTSNILCTQQLKEETEKLSAASFYHANRVKYRNLEQSNYYIDYYLLN